MQDVTLIGIDLGKHSFHVHGQDQHGKALLRKKFNRKQLIEFLAKFPVCTVVMEACAGAHHMARQLVRLPARRQADLATVRVPLRQEQQERFCGCRGDLRSGQPPSDAFCHTQERCPANPVGPAPRA